MKKEASSTKPKYVDRHTGTGTKHRTDADLERILDKVLSVIKENGGMTNVRHCYYRLRDAKIMRNLDADYSSASRYITQWRREGKIPWEAIVDGTRFYHKVPSSNSIYAALEEQARSFKLAMWRRQPKYIECWCEKNAIVSLLMPVASQYDIPIFPLRGQASDSAVFEIYMSLKRQRDAGKEIHILFFGDRDDAGHSIPKSVLKRLKENFNFEVDMEILAVTESQIEEYKLEPEPPKNKKCKITNCVEVDALSTPVLQALLTAAIKKHISPEEWARAEQDERLQKETADNFVNAFKTAAERGITDSWCKDEILTESNEKYEARMEYNKLDARLSKLYGDIYNILAEADKEKEGLNRPDVLQALQDAFVASQNMADELEPRYEELKYEWGF